MSTMTHSSVTTRGPIPSGGGVMRRLNMGTAILCGLIFAFAPMLVLTSHYAANPHECTAVEPSQPPRAPAIAR